MHFDNTESFTFSENAAKVSKFIGQLPTAVTGSDGTGLLGTYGGPRDVSGKSYGYLVYGTGWVLADASAIEALIPGYTQAAQENPGDFTPLDFLPSMSEDHLRAHDFLSRDFIGLAPP